MGVFWPRRLTPPRYDRAVEAARYDGGEGRALRRNMSMTRCVSRSALVLAGVVFAWAVPASAQDAFRQTVVVTAAATPVELGSVTRTLTIITRGEIAGLPVHSVADVLRLAASVDVRARGIRGVQTDFAVRGASFGQMLVLVDGVRLNDAQSGHHNGDIPVPLEAVERIEILYGPGSSLFGADAFGGTVNVITRRAAEPSLLLQGGASALVSGRAQGGFERGSVSQVLSASVDRSSGFMYDRDFKTAIARSRTSLGANTGVSLSYLWKEFGANNFYGGNAPSREWTNQALLAGDHRFGVGAGWSVGVNASYRTHGDRFLFNQERPALSDNRHRTHAVLASVTGSRRLRTTASLTVGLEGGGDWIRSTNLGEHSTSRISGFGAWRQELGRRAQLDATLRVDRYDEFGTSWSPSLGVGWWPSTAVRLRASAGRAFRVPTFTERYYSDPANLARAEVGPETAWAGEGGADLFLPNGWLLQATVFGRADQDVIDWLRPSVAERWRTYNIRDVDTRGIELGVRRTFQTSVFVQVQYTALALDAAAVDQLSKYVLDYAPRSLTAGASVPLPGRVRLAPRIEYRRRSRSTGTSEYVLLDTRIGRRFGRMLELFVEGTNLLDAEYQEVAGVAMPGAAMSISLAVGSR
jgi:outer membrane cobalamin receptor